MKKYGWEKVLAILSAPFARMSAWEKIFSILTVFSPLFLFLMLLINKRLIDSDAPGWLILLIVLGLLGTIASPGA